MTATPAYWMNGIPDRMPIAMHAKTGVCSLGLTLRNQRDPGRRSSRDMPKQRRIVDVSIARQQTKIAADTTSKNTVENALPKFASMICAGTQPSLIAVAMFGMPSSIAYRKIAPITNAPITDAITALGASVRGLFVSSESVDAVSKP